MDTYILVDKHPVIENNLLMWATWRQLNNMTLNKTKIDNVEISTVFLGIDHQPQYNSKEPILFETMIFGGKYDEYTWRYVTYDEAIAGHDKAVDKVILNK